MFRVNTRRGGGSGRVFPQEVVEWIHLEEASFKNAPNRSLAHPHQPAVESPVKPGETTTTTTDGVMWWRSSELCSASSVGWSGQQTDPRHNNL